MKMNTLNRYYHNLTAEERFRLSRAAEGRSDEVEQKRLEDAAQRITVSMCDTSPYHDAFNLLELLVYIQAQEEAALYSDVREMSLDPLVEEMEQDVEKEAAKQAEQGNSPSSATDDGRGQTVPRPPKMEVLALLAGYSLRVTVDAWKQFCSRLGIPPFLLWREFPAFARLQLMLEVAEGDAVTPEEHLRLLNSIRRAGERELVQSDIRRTVENTASAFDRAFRKGARCHGAD